MREVPIIFRPELVRAILDGKKTQTRRLLDEKKLKVGLPVRVTSDCPPHCLPPEMIVARPGVYPARIYKMGAVAIDVDGQFLGVKPGEFHLECPLANGDTHLGNYGNDRMAWTITPYDSRLWVRERHAFVDKMVGGHELEEPCSVGYADHTARRFSADGSHALDTTNWNWSSPSIHWRSPIHMPRWACRLVLGVMIVRIERLQDITEADAIAEGFVADGNECAKGHFANAWEDINGKRAPWDSDPWVWVVGFEVG
jgi:hypothetical protein